MKKPMEIVLFDQLSHSQEVVDLWSSVFGYETAHNEPRLVLAKKLEVNDGLFFVPCLPRIK